MIVPNDLEGFDGAFVTNSVIEIRPVTSIGETHYARSEMIITLHSAYRNHMENSLFFL